MVISCVGLLVSYFKSLLINCFSNKLSTQLFSFSCDWAWSCGGSSLLEQHDTFLRGNQSFPYPEGEAFLAYLGNKKEICVFGSSGMREIMIEDVRRELTKLGDPRCSRTLGSLWLLACHSLK